MAAIFQKTISFLLMTGVTAVCLLTLSCGSKDPAPQPDWVFKPKGVFISYGADTMLNEFDGASHALQLVIYQFDTINRFNEFSENKDGLLTLLNGENFDQSVQAVKKIFIDPGASGTLVLDRAEKSRWVGVVAGYYKLAPGRVTCSFEIPHIIEKKGMMFAKEEVATILDLKVKLDLLPQEIKGTLLNE